MLLLKLVSAGNFYVDGGAMFGVVPKILWSKSYPCDERNLCKIALRSLVIDMGERIFLVDTGCGTKFSERFYRVNQIDRYDDLLENLAFAGYDPTQITDVILTHLHFDHCGGSTYKSSSGELAPTFPNASYYTTQPQFDNLMHPTNIREGSAMYKDDVVPLLKSGQLKFVDGSGEWIKGKVGYQVFNGHTPGQIIPWVNMEDRKIHFTADLIPLVGNIRTAWVSAYDCYPVESMEEKVRFLNEVEANNDLLLFQHDYYTECAEVKKTPKGFVAGKKGKLSTFIADQHPLPIS